MVAHNILNEGSMTCDALRTPANGIVTLKTLGSVDVLPGSHADYTCNKGHEIIGSSMRCCQTDGSWSGTEPHCAESNVSLL